MSSVSEQSDRGHTTYLQIAQHAVSPSPPSGPPSFSLSVPSGSVQQYLEGSSQVVMVQGLDLGKPPVPGVEWSVNGGGLTSGGGVTVSDASISFSDVRRSHSGEYSAGVSNVHGNVTADFTVDVTCECSLFAQMTIWCRTKLMTMNMKNEYIIREYTNKYENII